MSSTSIRVRPLSRTARTTSDPSRTCGSEAVPHRILHERLNDEQRHAGIGDVGREVDRDLEPIGEARPLNLEVALDDLQLLAQRRMAIPGVEHVAEQIAEGGHQAHDAGRVPGTRQRGDAVQAVEEEVRLEVPAQRLQPRRRELGLQPRGRHLAILVALVQRHGRAGAGNRRVDEELQVQPPAQLHQEALPHRHVLVGEREREQRHDEGVRERDDREHGQMRDQEPEPAAEQLGQPAARDVPDAMVKGIHAAKYVVCHTSAARTSTRSPGVRAIHRICAADIAATNSQKPAAAVHTARRLSSDGRARSLIVHSLAHARAGPRECGSLQR